MPQTKLVIWLLACLLVISACSKEQTTTHHSLYVFGTTVEIHIARTSPSTAKLAIETIDQEFQRIHRDWHAWKPGALVSMNQVIANKKSFVVTNETASVISKAQTLAQQSENLFNPAIGQLIALWGFHADTRPSGPPPDATKIKALVRLRRA